MIDKLAKLQFRWILPCIEDSWAALLSQGHRECMVDLWRFESSTQGTPRRLHQCSLNTARHKACIG